MPFEKIETLWIKEISDSIVAHKNDRVDQYPARFYWQIIGGICKRPDLIGHYRILKELAQIHSNHNMVMELKKCDFEDIKAYFSLVENLKKQLIGRKERSFNVATFDEINEFLEMYDDHKAIAVKFGIKLYNAKHKEMVAGAKEEFIRCHQRLSQLLIKVHPKKSW